MPLENSKRVRSRDVCVSATNPSSRRGHKLRDESRMSEGSGVSLLNKAPGLGPLISARWVRRNERVNQTLFVLRPGSAPVSRSLSGLVITWCMLLLVVRFDPSFSVVSWVELFHFLLKSKRRLAKKMVAETNMQWNTRTGLKSQRCSFFVNLRIVVSSLWKD